MQKNLLYEIKAVESVHILPDYQHFSFMGYEPDEALQNLVEKILTGQVVKADQRWLDFVVER